MTRSTKSAAYVALLEAALDRARDLLDESEASPQAVAMADALDDVDNYCERCDSTGVVEHVHNAYTSTCDPADVRERPCDCEAGRIVAEQRRAGREPCEEVPC